VPGSHRATGSCLRLPLGVRWEGSRGGERGRGLQAAGSAGGGAPQVPGVEAGGPRGAGRTPALPPWGAGGRRSPRDDPKARLTVPRSWRMDTVALSPLWRPPTSERRHRDPSSRLESPLGPQAPGEQEGLVLGRHSAIPAVHGAQERLGASTQGPPRSCAPLEAALGLLPPHWARGPLPSAGVGGWVQGRQTRGCAAALWAHRRRTALGASGWGLRRARWWRRRRGLEAGASAAGWAAGALLLRAIAGRV